MLSLHKPSLELLPSYLSFMNEMAQIGEKIWEGTVPATNQSAEQFIEQLLKDETQPAGDKVPETHYWATINNEVVGRISFRHQLNDNLKEFGGHIGYEVRPSQRRKGVAKAMLKAVLETPRAKQIGQLLLTCAPDNIASNKTITANGGVLKETKFLQKWNRQTNYYWIDLKK